MAFAGSIGYKILPFVGLIFQPRLAPKADPKTRYQTQFDVRFQ